MSAPLSTAPPPSSDATEWVSDEPSSRRYGRYQVVRTLGSGAMGEVYAARDTTLGREVALKVMRPQRGAAAEAFRARFEVEARAAACLVHPAVVQVFDIGWHRDEPYLVLELVRGGTLKDRMASGPLSTSEIQGLGIRIGGALAAAHALGVVHRDVKPANILRGDDGWKLGDFGVAHVPGAELTMTGAFLGTPAYAAPEALAEGVSSPACDVYSLGATLYVAATGQAPYAGELGALTGQAPVPVATRAAALPPWVAAAITAALERDPARRPTAAQLVAMLDSRPSAGGTATAVVPPRPDGRRRPWAWVGLALGAVLLIALLASQRDGNGAPTSPRPFSDVPAAAAPVDGTAPVGGWSAERDARWQDALHAMQDGAVDEAMDKLAEILEEDPSDAQARELYEVLRDQAVHPGRGKRKHKKFK